MNIELSQKVAKYLCGQPVTVRSRQPHIAQASGFTYRHPEAGAIIDVRPGMTAADELETFLHECAHVKMHYENLLVTRHSELPSASYRYSDHIMNVRAASPHKQETEADALTVEWMRYAMAAGPDPTARLQRMLGWYPAELRAMIAAIVPGAVRAALNPEPTKVIQPFKPLSPTAKVVTTKRNR